MGLLIALMALCVSLALEILLRFATRYRRTKAPSHQPDLVVPPEDSLQSLITGLLIALMALRVSSALEILLRFAARYFSDHEDPSFQRVSQQVQFTNHEREETIRCRSSPHPRDLAFVGRGEILDRLMSLVPPSMDSSDCKKTILYGVAGVGKTAIATEFAFRFRTSYPDFSILWASAFNATGFQNSCHKILQQLQREDPHAAYICDNAVEVKLQFQLGLSRHPGPWLLIIDDVNDGELGSHKMNLASFLPFSRQGSILILTRNDRVSYELGISPNHTVRVGELRPDEGLEMFNKTLDGLAVGHLNETADLIHFLECSPLAIKQAASYIKQTKISVNQYLERYFSIDPVQVKSLSRGLPYAKSSRDPITSTWYLSFEHLEANATMCAKALKCISMLAAVNIPSAIFDHFGPSDDTDVPSKSSESSPSLPSINSSGSRLSPYSRDRTDSPMSVRDSEARSSEDFDASTRPKPALQLYRWLDAAAGSISTSSKASSKTGQVLQGTGVALLDDARGRRGPSVADLLGKNVIATLELYGLLTPQANGELVDIPRSVRQATRNLLFQTRNTCDQVSEAANAIRRHFPLPWADLNLCTLLDYTPHLEELMATGNIQVGESHQDELLLMLAEAYLRLYKLEDVEDIRRKLAVDTMIVYGENKLLTWKRMMDLVEILFDRTNYNEALEINTTSLRNIKRIEEDTSSSPDSTLASMAMLGKIYEKLEMFEERDKNRAEQKSSVQRMRQDFAMLRSPTSKGKQNGSPNGHKMQNRHTLSPP